MKFYEVVEQIIMLLRREGRISCRALKREFDLDEEYLQDLKEELIIAKRLASDEDGKVLVWAGASPVPSSEFRVPLIPKQLSVPSRQLSVLPNLLLYRLRTPSPELRTLSPPTLRALRFTTHAQRPSDGS